MSSLCLVQRHPYPLPEHNTRGRGYIRNQVDKKPADQETRADRDQQKRGARQHTQGNKQAEDEANREAEGKIAEIKEAGLKNQDKVIGDLLSAVFEVHPEPIGA